MPSKKINSTQKGETLLKPKKRGRPKNTEQEKIEKEKSKIQYWEAVGRRKTSSARIRLFVGKEKGFWINEKKTEEYFPQFEFQEKIFAPLKVLNLEDFSFTVKVKGGGLNAQAEAIKHGLARALVKYNPDFKPTLKSFGFLTRDPRMKERKKFGLKRARRAPQWQKR